MKREVGVVSFNTHSEDIEWTFQPLASSAFESIISASIFPETINISSRKAKEGMIVCCAGSCIGKEYTKNVRESTPSLHRTCYLELLFIQSSKTFLHSCIDHLPFVADCQNKVRDVNPPLHIVIVSSYVYTNHDETSP